MKQLITDMTGLIGFGLLTAGVYLYAGLPASLMLSGCLLLLYALVQVQSDLPWWLVCRGAIHKFRCVPHLTGRRFEHGVTDCYTLFRDAYHLAEIEMPDFYRGDDWWRNGQNLYLDNMEATGFYRVALTEAQPGDVLLCCFGSSVPNHAAIYCGDGELLHHIPEQLSKRERYTDKWQRRTHSLWRHRAWHASAFTGIYNDLVAVSTFV